ncbi:hypothetical protein N9287_00760 [Candidatus Pelagibacter sp.]|jgi:hypothetical protein|nr:hypothetical protein [Candidatus Pelagibacter sp.]
MKKIIITFVIILALLIFNKTIISQLIIFTTSKMMDRNISIESIDIDYLKKQIILKSVEVESTNKIYYKNIFEVDKIKIKYDFKSLFSDMIIIDHLIFYNSKIFLDIEIDINNEVVSNDNFEEVKKQEEGYEPKIYPIKKKDINFLILKFQTYDSQGFIKPSNTSNEIKINLSNMIFNKIGNETGLQHYKAVFKIILGDIFLRIPDLNLKKLIKKTYKF